MQDHDQPIPKVVEKLDGGKSDNGDLTDGNSSIQSEESASYEKVARICEGMIDSCMVRCATIPVDAQVKEPILEHLNPYGDVHGTGPAAPVLNSQVRQHLILGHRALIQKLRTTKL